MNTAWGQAVLLLDMMTRMYPDFKWEQGVLKPMGSHSMVSTALDDGTSPTAPDLCAGDALQLKSDCRFFVACTAASQGLGFVFQAVGSLQPCLVE